MASDLVRLTLTCRLTKDPELRSTPSGMSVCSMRVAYTTRRKDNAGNWGDKSNYLDVTVWGNSADRCAQYLNKGRRIAVDGRLEWREWEAQDGSGKRQAYECVADSVIFLDYKEDSDGGSGSGASNFTPSTAPADDFVPAGVGNSDDDIPF